MKGKFVPRSIDRAIFSVLGFLHIANGVYLTGPWYLDVTATGRAPLVSMFNSDAAVTLFGALILINGCALLYVGLAKHTVRWYTWLVSNSLLFGFVLRLYSLVGVLLVIDSWRPPSYLSHTASVLFLGAYWIWVRVYARPAE